MKEKSRILGPDRRKIRDISCPWFSDRNSHSRIFLNFRKWFRDPRIARLLDLLGPVLLTISNHISLSFLTSLDLEEADFHKVTTSGDIQKETPINNVPYFFHFLSPLKPKKNHSFLINFYIRFKRLKTLVRKVTKCYFCHLPVEIDKLTRLTPSFSSLTSHLFNFAHSTTPVFAFEFFFLSFNF